MARQDGLEAHEDEQGTFNPQVVGANPTKLAHLLRKL